MEIAQRVHFDALEQAAGSSLAYNLAAGPPRTIEDAMMRLGMDGESWAAWRALARLIDGAELTAADREIVQARTGAEPPTGTIREVWGVVARRGGKSQWAALAAVVWACRRYPAVTEPTVAIVARSRDQAKVCMGYTMAAAERLGVLEGKPAATSITIKGGVKIRVLANNSSVRGPTYVAAVLDEIAHYDTAPDAAWSDRDLETAIRPGLSSVRNPLLVAISSPWKKRGLLAEAKIEWDKGPAHRPAGRLVWHGATRDMNPTISQATIDADIRLNPGLAPEYSGDFFFAGSAWLPPDVLTEEKVKKMPLPGVKPDGPGRLYAFVDASGGGGKDAFALGIAQTIPVIEEDWSTGVKREQPDLRRARIIDLLHIPATFEPEGAVAKAAELLKKYRIKMVVGDVFSPGFQPAMWRKAGIHYVTATRPASDIYHATLSALISGRIDLVRHDVLIDEIRDLVEVDSRRPPPRIEHPPGGHDDLANAVLGAALEALEDASMASSA